MQQDWVKKPRFKLTFLHFWFPRLNVVECLEWVFSVRCLYTSFRYFHFVVYDIKVRKYKPNICTCTWWSKHTYCHTVLDFSSWVVTVLRKVRFFYLVLITSQMQPINIPEKHPWVLEIHKHPSAILLSFVPVWHHALLQTLEARLTIWKENQPRYVTLHEGFPQTAVLNPMRSFNSIPDQQLLLLVVEEIENDAQ